MRCQLYEAVYCALALTIPVYMFIALVQSYLGTNKQCTHRSVALFPHFRTVLICSCSRQTQRIEEGLGRIEYRTQDMYSLGLVHGDLKCHNVSIDAQGNVKVLDVCSGDDAWLFLATGRR